MVWMSPLAVTEQDISTGNDGETSGRVNGPGFLPVLRFLLRQGNESHPRKVADVSKIGAVVRFTGLTEDQVTVGQISCFP